LLTREAYIKTTSTPINQQNSIYICHRAAIKMNISPNYFPNDIINAKYLQEGEKLQITHQ